MKTLACASVPVDASGRNNSFSDVVNLIKCVQGFLGDICDNVIDFISRQVLITVDADIGGAVQPASPVEDLSERLGEEMVTVEAVMRLILTHAAFRVVVPGL